MKPLVIITTYNRRELTEQTLTSLEPSLHALQTVIVDNGSESKCVAWITAWVQRQAKEHAVELIALPQNVGCPRALNLALAYRAPGQAVIKLDNDVIMPDNAAWLQGIEQLVQTYHHSIALVGAFYDSLVSSGQIRAQLPRWQGRDLYAVYPVVGHAVYHAGDFMDEVGYFDVLAPEHLYGFEDNLISAKAAYMNRLTLAWEGWRIENIQRHSAIGNREVRDAHVESMRPLYNRRLAALGRDRAFYTGPDGNPTTRPL